MKLVYGVKDRPSFAKTLVFAFQQLLAILAATIAVPAIVGHGMSQSAALFGAGVGTIVYLLFTRFKSPVFLGSSFAFLGSMASAFAGGVSMSLGYLGLIIGAAFAALVYVIIALVVKFVGTNWISKIMPAVVIGPTVAIIGLSLAGNAIGDLSTGIAGVTNPRIALICGLAALFGIIVTSVFGRMFLKMIPFIVGIIVGYLVALVFTLIGNGTGNEALKVIDFSIFNDIKWIPDFTFITAFSGNYELGEISNMGSYILTIAVAYIPVAFVVFAEHIADHKNLSSIIEHDLLEDPGLHNTLLGDGVGSFAGALFGGCPNTTYGESVGCVAISRNASVVTIFTTAIFAILLSFFGPFITFLASIPKCVMGGVCVTLYGFIAVSGLKMIQDRNLNDNRNLFVVSVILIAGVGNLSVNFGSVTITEVACALILGIVTNLICNGILGKKGREIRAAKEAAREEAKAQVDAQLKENQEQEQAQEEQPQQ